MIREDVDGVDYGFDGNEVQQGVVGDCLSVSELKKKYSQCWEVSEKEKKRWIVPVYSEHSMMLMMLMMVGWCASMVTTFSEVP